MIFSFNPEREKDPVVTSAVQNDVLGGFIEPAELLTDDTQIKTVEAAVAIVQAFLEAAEERGVIIAN